MTNDEGRESEGAPERSPKAGAGAPSGVDGNGPSCPCLLFESGAELLDHRSPVCIYDALETDWLAEATGFKLLHLQIRSAELLGPHARRGPPMHACSIAPVGRSAPTTPRSTSAFIPITDQATQFCMR